MNKKAYFGSFGGQFVPETAMFALEELEDAYNTIAQTKEFKDELGYLLREYAGRPTPLYHAVRLSEHYGHEIYLKREDLNHTGAHKINNALAQALLAKQMGKKKVIAETGAGQHGVATATAAALFGLECDVYMGETDAARQQLNAFRMQLLGANLIKIGTGLKTLKEATTAAIQAWVNEIESVFYVIGSAVGPHPYPKMVRDFQSVIGTETRSQLASKGIKADYVLACVGGGSNAIGIFSAFVDDPAVQLIGVEAGGLGAHTPYHAATITNGRAGIIHGMKTIVLQDKFGMIEPVHSISAGLDYPGIGPLISQIAVQERAEVLSINDDEALRAAFELTRLEGIIPALESSHALGLLPHMKLQPEDVVVLTVSGRGDKDISTYLAHKAEILGE